jgi:hypothetical protein
MTFRVLQTRWKYFVGIEDHTTGLLTGFCGQADTEEYCQALVEHQCQQIRGPEIRVVSVEIGELCASCEGEGFVSAGNDGRVLCDDCGGHQGILSMALAH